MSTLSYANASNAISFSTSNVAVAGSIAATSNVSCATLSASTSISSGGNVIAIGGYVPLSALSNSVSLSTLPGQLRASAFSSNTIPLSALSNFAQGSSSSTLTNATGTLSNVSVVGTLTTAAVNAGANYVTCGGCSFTGTSSCSIYNGNFDNASYGGDNLVIESWNGIGFRCSCGPWLGIHIYMDTRGGSINASSKNFCIPHPILPNKLLIHSSIEGPRVDLMYRGRKRLVDGKIDVDLNKEITSNGSTMADGTFQALCTNPQVFLQNNETFDRVVGSVDGSTLSIRCEVATASNYVDWMVVAERKDAGIVKSKYSDSNGALILEHDA